MNKYRNILCEMNGITFDSKKEMAKYQDLLLLQKGGEVISFSVHPRFQITDTLEKDGEKYRPRFYEADFAVTYKDGMKEIIDIKPWDETKQKFLITPLAQMKILLFDIRYPDLHLTIE